MFWIIVIIGIVGYILYSFLKDKDKMLKNQVDAYGGMAKKYEYLIRGLIDNRPNARITELKRGSITLFIPMEVTGHNYFIDELFNYTVQVEYICKSAIGEIYKYKWTFPDNYPQEKMVSEILEHLEWKFSQLSNYQ